MPTRRSLLRALPPVVGLAMALVVVPALLIVVCRQRFGHASPLHGMDAPWRWTLDAARSWGRRITGELDTSRELVDLFLRVAFVLAWSCLVVLVVTIVSESAFQLRHGMPSSGHRSVVGLARLGRVVATGLVGLLPLASGAPALAGGPTHARTTATAPFVRHGADRTRAEPAGTPQPQPGWTTYRVQRGDSIWSIAAHLVGADDVPDVAQQIVDANRGTTMTDGHRFTTPALIEPGWELVIPADAASPDAVPAAPARAAADDPVADPGVPADHAITHEVVAGDSYWRIAADRLAEVGGVRPSDAEVLRSTEQLLAHNAPLLGHDDPRLILPGEEVVFVDAATAPAVEPVALEPAAAPAVEPVVVGPVVTDPVVTEPVVTEPVVTEPAVVAPPLAVGLPGRVPADAPPAVARPGDVFVEPAPAADPVASSATRPAPIKTLAPHEATVDEGGPGVELSAVLELGGALVLAAGAVVLLDARRRQRLRAALFGARLGPPVEAHVGAEVALRAASAPERLARLDLALRAAALDLAEAGVRVCTAEVGDEGEVRLVLDGSATPSGTTWRLDIDDGTWVLPGRVRTEELAAAARHAGMPCPALLHLGATAGGQLFIDVEALGVLCVDVPDPLGRDIVRCLAASMAVSPFAAAAHVIVVGLEPELALGTSIEVLHADSVDAALELGAERLGTTRTISRGTSTFALRARSNGGETWEPAIVFAAAGAVGAAEPAVVVGVGEGLAIVTNGPVVDTPGGVAPWSLRVEQEQFVLQPLGIAVTPCGLGHRGLLDLRALLATAEQPLEVRARVVPIDGGGAAGRAAGAFGDALIWADDESADAGEPPAFVVPACSLIVRLLGHVEVVTADGAPAVFERSKALELVVWLSQHRERPTRTGARTALWDLDVRDATFANVVSDARRAMARALPPPPGEEWLARTLTEELPLHRAVITDADVLAARVAHARDLRGAAAIAVLRPGLELVSGMPFAGTSYLWTDAEGIATALTLLVVGAAAELAKHCLDAGDPEGVFWATGQGLKALPGHEELIALRMRAHAGAGDLAGVRHEWEAYERALDADQWAAAQPSPKLVALRRELLAPSAAVS
ncbi:MAG: hypothetical protein JWM12_1885 [Ilumatobacteraceae bacterium]|nr:hypothetical protein [Ilumatobacteraceae bacterium]